MRLAAPIAALVMTAVLAPAPAAADPLEWRPCPAGSGLERTPTAQCASVSVPMDYARPKGSRIDVMFSRIPAQGTSVGAIFANPGGPGAETLDFWTRPMPAALAAYDRIAVEPRGLRWSTPLDCRLPGIKPDRIPQGFPAVPDRVACEGRQPGYIGTITTEATARDLDAVREALGEDKIDLIGYSAGTNLFAVYATLFPDRVDKLVLDSGIGPSGIWSEHYGRVLQAWQHRLDDMFDWIAANHAIYALGSTRAAVYDEWSRQVASQGGGFLANLGATSSGIDDDTEWRLANLARAVRNPSVTQGRTFSATFTALYSRQQWPYLAQGMRELRDSGNRRFLDFLARRTPVSSVPSGWVFEAINCNEDRTAIPVALTATLATFATGGSALEAVSALQRSGFACFGWKQTTRPVSPNGTKLATRPLSIQSERDAATPVAGGIELAETMGARIIRVAGGDHGNFGSGDPVLDAAVVADLATGDVSITTAAERPVTTANPPTQVPG